MTKRVSILFIAVMALLLVAAPALAGPVIDKAAASLRNDPVYVDPGAATTLAPDAAARVRAHITSGQASIFVAALPADVTSEVNGNADEMPAALGRAIGRNGAVGVVTSKSFRAGASSNSGLARGQAGELANLAFAAHKAQGPEAVLQDWISRVQDAVGKNRASTASGTAQAKELKPKKSHTGLIVFLVLIGLLVLVVAVWMVVATAAKRRRFRAAKSKTDSQVAALGSQVLQYSSVDEPEIAEASERYSWASSALSKARSVEDLEAINGACAEGFEAIRRYQHKNDPAPSAAYRYGDAPKEPEPRIRAVRADEPEAEQRPVERPAPQNTTVVNNYGNTGQPGYWYGGGWYGGSYYGPGYYSSMNFWEGMMLGEMLSDHDHYDHDYDRGDRDSGGDDYSGDSDSGGGDWDTGGGDTSGGSDSGGGDWSPSPEPSYEPSPSYESSGDSGGGYDSGGFDSGGGDFGGGGGDFGGGGGDFGGSGGGDF